MFFHRIYKCRRCGEETFVSIHSDGWDIEWGCECGEEYLEEEKPEHGEQTQREEGVSSDG